MYVELCFLFHPLTFYFSSQYFSIASLSHSNPGGLEEWVINKTNIMTSTANIRRANLATPVSQDTRNTGCAGNSSLVTPDTVSSTMAVRKKSQAMDATQVIRTITSIPALV